MEFSSDDELALHVKKQAEVQAVIVYCKESSFNTLKAKIPTFKHVTPGIDDDLLRRLDKRNAEGLYEVLLVTSSFGTRGLVYRSHSHKNVLIIAKSFDSERDC
jgi:hypothetical protein